MKSGAKFAVLLTATIVVLAPVRAQAGSVVTIDPRSVVYGAYEYAFPPPGNKAGCLGPCGQPVPKSGPASAFAAQTTSAIGNVSAAVGLSTYPAIVVSASAYTSPQSPGPYPNAQAYGSS
jgi:hypothetical protein